MVIHDMVEWAFLGASCGSQFFAEVTDHQIEFFHHLHLQHKHIIETHWQVGEQLGLGVNHQVNRPLCPSE